jgi:hypothetical protein
MGQEVICPAAFHERARTKRRKCKRKLNAFGYAMMHPEGARFLPEVGACVDLRIRQAKSQRTPARGARLSQLKAWVNNYFSAIVAPLPRRTEFFHF